MEVPADLVLAVAALELDQQDAAERDAVGLALDRPDAAEARVVRASPSQRSIVACASSSDSIALGGLPSHATTSQRE